MEPGVKEQLIPPPSPICSQEPLYEAEIFLNPPKEEPAAHLNQFIIHSAIDLVERQAWTTTAMCVCSSRHRLESEPTARVRTPVVALPALTRNRRLSCRNLHAVDRVYDQTVSAFLSAGNIKFMLLHEGRNEDNIRTFFNEVHAMYVQFLMNPFYEYQTPIVSQQFDKRVLLHS